MLRLLAVLITLGLAAPATVTASRMPAPPRVTLHENTPCPDIGGSCSYADANDVFLEPDASRFERHHELGHQFDRQVLTDPDREWFIARLGFQPGPWDRGTGWGMRGPDEVFADAYSACALGLSPGGKRRRHMRVVRWTTSYGYYPTVTQHRQMCNAIVVLGLVRAGLRAYR